MTALPVMPVYVGDMIADTTHLSAEAIGAYHLLLYWCWWHKGKPLPDDDASLARICRTGTARWRKVLRPVLAPFFTVDDGGWTNERLAEEFAAAVGKVERARENGRRGGRPPAREPEENPEQTGRLAEPEPTGNPPGNQMGNPDQTQRSTETEPTGQPEANPNGTHGRSYPDPERVDDDDGARAGDRVIDIGWETDATALAGAIAPQDPATIDADPAVAAGAVRAAALFLAERNRRWPHDVRMPAPHLTLFAQAAAYIRMGATAELVGAVLARGMDEEYRAGAGPPTTLEFRKHQIAKESRRLKRALAEVGNAVDVEIVGSDGAPGRPAGRGGGGHANPFDAAMANLRRRGPGAFG